MIIVDTNVILAFLLTEGITRKIISSRDVFITPEHCFEELPDDWTCPVCGSDKSKFEKGVKK